MLRTPPRGAPSYTELPLPDSPGRTPMRPSADDLNVEKHHDDTPTPQGRQFSPSVDDLSDEDIMAQIRSLQAILQNRNNKKGSNYNQNKISARSPTSDDDGSPSGTSPLQMDTSFGSTSSLVSAVHRSIGRKRKGSSSPASSPARRLRVSAQIHAPVDAEPSGCKTSPGGQKTSTDGCLPSRQNRRTPKPDLRPNDDTNNIEIFSLSDRTQPDNNTQSRRFPPLPIRPQRPQLPTTARDILPVGSYSARQQHPVKEVPSATYSPSEASVADHGSRAGGRKNTSGPSPYGSRAGGRKNTSGPSPCRFGRKNPPCSPQG
ncbi:hypothetical protein QE152_g39528 [Popillia japonica]|uniref:Uncharacterized protein n=1 Tax=Popillia japonica TaxID=7064 RepID=A0AAW1HTL0_POPJA